MIAHNQEPGMWEYDTEAFEGSPTARLNGRAVEGWEAFAVTLGGYIGETFFPQRLFAYYRRIRDVELPDEVKQRARRGK
jgi:hypothetical protein